MIDIHSHTLPGIDDGAKTIGETKEMLSGFAGLGYSRIVATPHWAIGMPPVSEEAVRQAKGVADELGIQLSIARECRIHPRLLQEIDSRPDLRIDGGKTILVELPWGDTPSFTYTVFSGLISAGYQPILVHPERHRNLWDAASPLTHLLEANVPLQVNLSSIVGMHGAGAQDRAIELLESGSVSFVASDAHSPQDLKSPVPEGIQRLVELVGNDATDLLTAENPWNLFAGKDLISLRELNPPVQVNRSVIAPNSVNKSRWNRPLGRVIKRLRK